METIYDADNADDSALLEPVPAEIIMHRHWPLWEFRLNTVRVF